MRCIRSTRCLRVATVRMAVVALLLAMVLPVRVAQARPEGKPLTLGFGIAGSRVTGDLDGATVIQHDPTNGPVSYLAKPDNGGGSMIFAGYNVTPHFGIEALLLGTRHIAKHDAFPGTDLNTHITSLLGTLRFMLPLGETFEAFGRVGLGPVAVNYTDNTLLPPNSTRLSSSMTGIGAAAGLGIAVFFDPLGLELAVLKERARLTELIAAEQAVPEFKDAYIGLGTVTLTLTMHFKGP